MSKLLVIEDNEEVRENLVEILDLAGYETSAAENGKAGLRLAEQELPDLILCDVMMPELDGFGVLKIKNNNPKINHIPLIFLTAKAENEDVRKGMGLGAEDYITKPFDDTQLLEAIEIRLKKATQNTALAQVDADSHQFYSPAKANEGFQTLLGDCETRKFQPKDVVYEEGQIARWLFYVVVGQIKLYQMNEYGKELITQIIKPGEVFGYYPLINESTYTNFAAVTTDSSLQLIPKKAFKELLFKHRDFTAQFIQGMARRGAQTEMVMLELAYSSVRKKVANALVAFADKSTITAREKIYIHVSRDDLAAMAGTAKETLIRTLSDFKIENLIEIDAKSILILKLDDLENIIG